MARKASQGRGKKMNAIDLLMSQHREVEERFSEFQAAEDEDECEEAFQQIADQLAMHAEIEEKIFYPACKAKATEDQLRESLEEHLAVKRLIADLVALDPKDEQFEAKMDVLKEQVEHHVEEEENTLFPKVRKLLGEEQLLALAGEMAALMAELEHGTPREKVPHETESAPPL
jgi:hemerythrin superfamily protein